MTAPPRSTPRLPDSSTSHWPRTSAAVISGIEVTGEVFRRVDPTAVFTPLIADGDTVAAMTLIATIEGPARGVLAGERVALNLLQRLSGVATLTARYVDAVRETKARIVDTRKTTLGLRALEKAAVRHGGGTTTASGRPTAC